MSTVDFIEVPARLALSAEEREASLVLTYAVHSDCDVEIGLLDRLEERGADGAPIFDPAFAYVDLEPPLLHVHKRLLSVPPGLFVSAITVPGITRLAPRQSLEGEIAIPLPVKACNPYLRALRRGAAPSERTSVDRVALTLGYFRVEPGARFYPVSPAFSDIWAVYPPNVLARQALLRAEARLARPVEALDYELVTTPPAGG